MDNLQKEKENQSTIEDIDICFKPSRYILEDYIISEEDFYPPQDDRLFCSGIDDIEGGDTFEEFVKDFFEIYGEDLFDT